MAAGAVGALLGAPELFETVDDMLTCLLDVLGLRKIEPLLPGRVCGWVWDGIEAWLGIPWFEISARSTIVLRL